MKNKKIFKKSITAMAMATAVTATSVGGPIAPYNGIVKVSAVANEKFTDNGISYQVNEDNLTCKITAVENADVEEFVIPDVVCNIR